VERGNLSTPTGRSYGADLPKERPLSANRPLLSELTKEEGVGLIIISA
jgi:hypothetical protein